MGLFEEEKSCQDKVLEHAKSGGMIGASLGLLFGIATAGSKKAGGSNVINNMISHGMNKGVFGATVMAVYAATKMCSKENPDDVLKEIGDTTKDVVDYVKSFGKDEKKDEITNFFGFMKNAGNNEKADAKDILEFAKKIGKE